MKLFIIIVFLVGLFNSSFSQKAPGYLGKKSKIVYSTLISPSLANPTQSGGDGMFSFNISHNITIERAISRVRSLAFSFEMFKSQTDMSTEFTELAYHPEFENGRGGYDLVEFSGSPNATLNVKAFSINSVKYGTGIAPFGVNFYWGVKFLMMEQDMSKTIFKASSYSYYNSSNTGITTPIYYETDDAYSFKTLGLNLGGEINRAIADMVVINLGVQSTLLPAYFGSFLNGGDGGTPSFQSELKYQHRSRMTLHQLFSMKIGVGILLP